LRTRSAAPEHDAKKPAFGCRVEQRAADRSEAAAPQTAGECNSEKPGVAVAYREVK